MYILKKIFAHETVHSKIDPRTNFRFRIDTFQTPSTHLGQTLLHTCFLSCNLSVFLTHDTYQVRILRYILWTRYQFYPKNIKFSQKKYYNRLLMKRQATLTRELMFVKVADINIWIMKPLLSKSMFHRFFDSLILWHYDMSMINIFVMVTVFHLILEVVTDVIFLQVFIPKFDQSF